MALSPMKKSTLTGWRNMSARKTDCNAGHMEVEAALIMFRRFLAKHGLCYTTVLFDGRRKCTALSRLRGRTA